VPDVFRGFFEVYQSYQTDQGVFKTLKLLWNKVFSKKLVGRSGWFGRAIRMVWSGDPDGFVFKLQPITSRALKPFLGGNFVENKNFENRNSENTNADLYAS